MRFYAVPTSRGEILYTAGAEWPDILLLHGFARGPAAHVSWVERIPGIGLGYLPSHGRAPPLDEASLEAWIEAWAEALARWPRPPILIGESLGGLIAFAMPVRAAVALDPPLAANQLWPMAVSVERARQRGETIVADYDALFDRSYHWLLDRIGAPTLVIAGDVPLMPPRPLQNPPSAVTDEDFQLMANHPLVEAHRVRGGHAILDENPEEVATLINDFIRRNS